MTVVDEPAAGSRWHDGVMTDAATATTSAPAPLFADVASRDAAIAHFSRRLQVEADVSDVATALEQGGADFVLVDTRDAAAWAQGHVPGALHLPRRAIAGSAHERVAPGTPVVVYCWGPACNGATRAALEFARLGHPVKEMIGGYEYWVREGLEYAVGEGDGDLHRAAPDPLTNVAHAGAHCAC